MFLQAKFPSKYQNIHTRCLAKGKGGPGGLSPSIRSPCSPLEAPQKWNDTLYKGLWSSSCHFESQSAPLAAPSFWKVKLRPCSLSWAFQIPNFSLTLCVCVGCVGVCVCAGGTLTWNRILNIFRLKGPYAQKSLSRTKVSPGLSGILSYLKGWFPLCLQSLFCII